MKHWYILVARTGRGERMDEWRRIDKCPAESWTWQGWTFTVCAAAPVLLGEVEGLKYTVCDAAPALK